MNLVHSDLWSLGSARPPDGRFNVRMPNAARPEAGPYQL